MRDINTITVTDRARKDIGDLSGLKASIKKLGYLHPLVLSPSGNLIDGYRRYLIAKELGHSQVPTRIVKNLDDAYKALLAERDANHERKDWTPEELKRMADKLLPFERELAKTRKKRKKKVGLFPSTGGNKHVRESKHKVAKAMGTSTTTLSRIDKVVAAAERNPTKYGPVLDEMNKTGKVNTALKKIKEGDTKKVQKLREAAEFNREFDKAVAIFKRIRKNKIAGIVGNWRVDDMENLLEAIQSLSVELVKWSEELESRIERQKYA